MSENMTGTRSVKIGGRTFELSFMMFAMTEIKKAMPEFDFGNVGEMISQPEGMLTALYAMAKCEAARKGETLDVDRDWFALHIPASARKMLYIQMAIMEAMTDAMEMEAEEDDDRSKEVDVVLREIQKKRTADS